MKKIIPFLAILLLGISCMNREKTSEVKFNPPYFNPEWPGRKLPGDSSEIAGMSGFIHDTIFSRINQVGMGYCIVLPGSYYQDTASRLQYPVIYFLHGYTGSETADVWIADYYFREVQKGNFPEFIMVFPNGMNEYYIDNYDGNTFVESYIIKELIPFLDENFRTDKNRRAIVGFSMGSYGAMRYYLKYNELFRSVLTIDGSMIGLNQDIRWTDTKSAFGNEENLRANSVVNLFNSLKTKNPEAIPELKIMIVEDNPEDPAEAMAGMKFAEFLEKNGVSPVYLRERLPHTPTVFYDHFLEEIIAFQRSSLTD